jgi:hypothetical protein
LLGALKVMCWVLLWLYPTLPWAMCGSQLEGVCLPVRAVTEWVPQAQDCVHKQKCASQVSQVNFTLSVRFGA